MGIEQSKIVQTDVNENELVLAEMNLPLLLDNMNRPEMVHIDLRDKEILPKLKLKTIDFGSDPTFEVVRRLQGGAREDKKQKFENKSQVPLLPVPHKELVPLLPVPHKLRKDATEQEIVQHNELIEQLKKVALRALPPLPQKLRKDAPDHEIKQRDDVIALRRRQRNKIYSIILIQEFV